MADDPTEVDVLPVYPAGFLDAHTIGRLDLGDYLDQTQRDIPKINQFAQAVPDHSAMETVLEAGHDRFGIQERDSREEDRRFTAQSNPTEFEDSVDIEWNRFSSPGASYAHMHYHSTKNYCVELELYWRAFAQAEVRESERVRKLLWSWCYPNRERGWSLGPPVLLATWPNAFSLSCYLVELKMQNLRFARDGTVTRWVAKMKLEENRDAFVSSAEVRTLGAIRGSKKY